MTRQDINTTIISGRLGAAITMHQKNGTEGPVKSASFSLAVDRVEKADKKTDWFRVVIIGEKQVATYTKHLDKGSAVTVEGSLRVHQWEDNKKVVHKDTEIVAKVIHFMGFNKKDKEKAV